MDYVRILADNESAKAECTIRNAKVNNYFHSYLLNYRYLIFYVRMVFLGVKIC